jgi:hypothetical protein
LESHSIKRLFITLEQKCGSLKMFQLHLTRVQAGRQAGHLLKSVRYALRLLTSVNDTRKNGQNKENKNIYFQQKFQSVNSF